jgi:chromosome segregation ATPase
MTGESYSDHLIHSLHNGGRDIKHEPNDTSHADGESRTDGDLKTSMSMASAQLGQDLRSVGSQLLSIETGHRTLMERIQRIAAQGNEHTVRQFEALQREDEDVRLQILNLREDLEAAQGSFPEQFKTIRNQCERFSQEIEQELRSAEDRIEKTASNRHHVVERRLNGTDEQLQATVQQLELFKQQLTDIIGRIKTIEPQITGCADRVQRNTGMLVEAKKTFDELASRRDNIVISVGALAQQMEQVKADLSHVSAARLKGLQVTVRSNQLMQGLAMVAWIMSLLLVGYIGIGDRGWSVLRQYLSQWVPGLFI